MLVTHESLIYEKGNPPNYKSAKLVLAYRKTNHLICSLNLFVRDQNCLFEPIFEICEAFCGRRCTFGIHITVELITDENRKDLSYKELAQSDNPRARRTTR